MDGKPGTCPSGFWVACLSLVGSGSLDWIAGSQGVLFRFGVSVFNGLQAEVILMIHVYLCNGWQIVI
jgi:hypothetical protein